MEVINGIAIVRSRYIDQVEQQPSPLNVPQKLNSQTMSKMSSLDQPGNIGYNERLVHIEGDNTELGFKGGERIVRDLRARRRYSRDQRRLADIRITDEANVRKELQFQSKRFLLARRSILRPFRRAI
jgi:hypothetical protein